MTDGNTVPTHPTVKQVSISIEHSLFGKQKRGCGMSWDVVLSKVQSATTKGYNRIFFCVIINSILK